MHCTFISTGIWSEPQNNDELYWMLICRGARLERFYCMLCNCFCVLIPSGAAPVVYNDLVTSSIYIGLCIACYKVYSTSTEQNFNVNIGSKFEWNAYSCKLVRKISPMSKKVLVWYWYYSIYLFAKMCKRYIEENMYKAFLLHRFSYINLVFWQDEIVVVMITVNNWTVLFLFTGIIIEIFVLPLAPIPQL